MTATDPNTHVSDIPAFGPLPAPPRQVDMRPETRYTDARAILRARFAVDESVLVAAEGYIIASRSKPESRLVPDLMIAFGVDVAAIMETEEYVIDEVGKPPDFALEVPTISAARRDYREKGRVRGDGNIRILAVRLHRQRIFRKAESGGTAPLWDCACIGKTASCVSTTRWKANSRFTL